MKKESGLCAICPIRATCSPRLKPEPDSRDQVLSNPWNCRHITCTVGVAHARRAEKTETAEELGKVMFDSPQKRGLTRRFDTTSRKIESLQGNEWYETGQIVPKRE